MIMKKPICHLSGGPAFKILAKAANSSRIVVAIFRTFLTVLKSLKQGLLMKYSEPIGYNSPIVAKTIRFEFAWSTAIISRFILIHLSSITE
jgi:hypothetical protein